MVYNGSISTNYGMSNPKEFYHEVHRPSHFLNFTSLEEGTDWNGADRDDMFA